MSLLDCFDFIAVGSHVKISLCSNFETWPVNFLTNGWVISSTSFAILCGTQSCSWQQHLHWATIIGKNRFFIGPKIFQLLILLITYLVAPIIGSVFIWRPMSLHDCFYTWVYQWYSILEYYFHIIWISIEIIFNSICVAIECTQNS